MIFLKAMFRGCYWVLDNCALVLLVKDLAFNKRNLRVETTKRVYNAIFAKYDFNVFVLPEILLLEMLLFVLSVTTLQTSCEFFGLLSISGLAPN